MSKSNRNSLTLEQQQFLERLVPWGRFLQEQTRIKAKVFKKITSPFGMYSSVFIADCIVQSGWGKHPLAQPLFKHKDVNNLSLMEIDAYWTKVDKVGKPAKIKYEGKDYKSFDGWEEFTIHYSDQIIFSGKFIDLLSTASIQEQTLCVGVYRSSSEAYNMRLDTLISYYGLEEFDNGFGT